MPDDQITYGVRNEADPVVLARLRAHKATAAAQPSMLGAGCVLREGAVKAMHNAGHFVGPAVTVGVDRIDHRTVLLAAEQAHEGDVLVIAAGGETRQAIWGSGLTRAAIASGLAAVVVDGVVCNTQELSELGLPIYALGANPATGGWEGRGSVNLPVIIGEMTVRSGDIIAGDDDGVVVIPRERALEVTEGVEAYAAMVATNRERLAAGEVLSDLRSWRRPKADDCLQSVPSSAQGLETDHLRRGGSGATRE